MKRWAFLTVVLYIIAVAVVSTPLFFLLGDSDFEEFLQVYFLFFLPVLVLVQGALLLIPVAVSQKRPVGKRTVLTSVIAAAAFMAILLSATLFMIFLMIFGEDSKAFDLVFLVDLGLLGALWVGWGFFFYRRSDPNNPASLTDTLTGWLLRASILEVLVAIPSHIISRERNECCAPPFTLLGLVTGLSVAIMAFGPGLFFLFAKKIQEKKKASSA
jgi:hypothetical protein